MSHLDHPSTGTSLPSLQTQGDILTDHASEAVTPAEAPSSNTIHPSDTADPQPQPPQPQTPHSLFNNRSGRFPRMFESTEDAEVVGQTIDTFPYFSDISEFHKYLLFMNFNQPTTPLILHDPMIHIYHPDIDDKFELLSVNPNTDADKPTTSQIFDDDAKFPPYFPDINDKFLLPSMNVNTDTDQPTTSQSQIFFDDTKNKGGKYVTRGTQTQTRHSLFENRSGRFPRTDFNPINRPTASQTLFDDSKFLPYYIPDINDKSPLKFVNVNTDADHPTTSQICDCTKIKCGKYAMRGKLADQNGFSTAHVNYSDGDILNPTSLTMHNLLRGILTNHSDPQILKKTDVEIKKEEDGFTLSRLETQVFIIEEEGGGMGGSSNEDEEYDLKVLNEEVETR